MLLGTEVLSARLGLPTIGGKQRLLYLVRGVIASALIAVWSGWYVDRARKQFEGARENLRKEQAKLAERAQRMEHAAGLAATLRIMGHEIRNPLHGIVLQCRILDRAVDALPKDGSAQAHESLAMLTTEVRRVSALLDEYMAHGRADRISLSEGPVNLGEVIDEVVALHDADLREHRLSLDVKVPADLPAIVGDAPKLAQVVHNLLRNSIDAVPPGGHIAVAARRDDSAVVLSVQDDGPGFAEPEAVFRPFYSTKPSAAGLGLSLVRDIVRAHRGDTRAENGPKGGALVEIRLPMKAAA